MDSKSEISKKSQITLIEKLILILDQLNSQRYIFITQAVNTF